MSGELVPTNNNGGSIMESVIIKGDLSRLSPEERSNYYMTVCKSVGLNPLTKPFEYISLNGKLTLYALRTCTDQLRAIHQVSVIEMTEKERDGVHIVTCKVANRDGRTDIATGAVNIAKLQGEVLANAIMKCETKAKRRATLSICGLGFLDETEIEDIPQESKSLPKAKAREPYKEIQDRIDKCESLQALRDAGEWFDARIASMPPDWREHLKLRRQEKLVDLQEQERLKGKRADDPPKDLEGFCKWADEKMSYITKPEVLDRAWEMAIDPHAKEFDDNAWLDVLKVYTKHEQRLAS